MDLVGAVNQRSLCLAKAGGLEPSRQCDGCGQLSEFAGRPC